VQDEIYTRFAEGASVEAPGGAILSLALAARAIHVEA
jgi:hypothetical protein